MPKEFMGGDMSSAPAMLMMMLPTTKRNWSREEDAVDQRRFIDH